MRDAKQRMAGLLAYQSPADAVRARLERQQILTKDGAPLLNFVLSESCIERMVADSRLMRRQLQHAADIAELPNVQL